MNMPAAALTALLIGWLAISASAGGLTVHDVGRFDLVDTGGSGAAELSGITWAGGNTYYAVSDSQANLFTLTIQVDPATGAISAGSIAASPLALRDAAGGPLPASDREGVALDGTAVWIADENGPQLSRHSLATGNRLAHVTTASHPQLQVFAAARGNFAWESLTRAPDGSAYWTANEEALTVDGDRSTTTAGSVIRLQKFDGAMNPLGQWAYVTAPINGGFGTSADRSGVVDLLALDGGRLLVLERSFGYGFQIRLYEVDFTGATDVSQAPFAAGLIGQSYTPVAKTELWSKTFGLLDSQANFEGITLGPLLSDGSRSVILIADNGGGTTHSLYALRVVPEPSTIVLLLMGIGGGAALLGARRRRSR